MFSEDDWGVKSPPQQIFRFDYHSQKVIGCLGFCSLDMFGSETTNENAGAEILQKMFGIVYSVV